MERIFARASDRPRPQRIRDRTRGGSTSGETPGDGGVCRAGTGCCGAERLHPDTRSRPRGIHLRRSVPGGGTAHHQRPERTACRGAGQHAHRARRRRRRTRQAGPRRRRGHPKLLAGRIFQGLRGDIRPRRQDALLGRQGHRGQPVLPGDHPAPGECGLLPGGQLDRVGSRRTAAADDRELRQDGGGDGARPRVRARHPVHGAHRRRQDPGARQGAAGRLFRRGVRAPCGTGRFEAFHTQHLRRAEQRARRDGRDPRRQSRRRRICARLGLRTGHRGADRLHRRPQGLRGHRHEERRGPPSRTATVVR